MFSTPVTCVLVKSWNAKNTLKVRNSISKRSTLVKASLEPLDQAFNNYALWKRCSKENVLSLPILKRKNWVEFHHTAWSCVHRMLIIPSVNQSDPQKMLPLVNESTSRATPRK